MHAHPLDARIARLEGGFDQVNERLGSIDRRLDGVDRRLDSFAQLMAARFDQSEHLTTLRFDQVEHRFTWLIGIVVGTWITTVLTVLFHR